MALHSLKWGWVWVSANKEMDVPPPRERAGLEQGSFLNLLAIAREGLSHELLTANTPGEQGTECLSPEGDLGIWVTCPTTTPSEYGTRASRGHISSFPSLCPHVITQGTHFFPSDFLKGALTLEFSLPCFHPMTCLSITQLCKQPSAESQSPWHYKTLLLWPLWTNALLFKGNFNLSPEKKNLMHWMFENSYTLVYPCDNW